MLEFEKTYLAKYLPLDLEKCEVRELMDIYIPADATHPKMRIRKKGDEYEITKKVRVHADDASVQEEYNISLTAGEFAPLSRVEGKRLRKLRYYYPYGELMAEVDVFQDDLAGLALIDFEFATAKEKDAFAMPDFCLAEVTQEDFVAGGMLCGKKYDEIEEELGRYGYERITHNS